MDMLSIIIPVFNEEDTIALLLDNISKNVSSGNILEIIVVDGGSSDQTKEIIRALPTNLPLVLLESAKGRAKQMNFGAQNSKGDILYFLHADTLPPKCFDRSILQEVASGNKAGCFRMKFDSRHPILKFSQWFTRFNWKTCRGGDQSLFITKEQFNSLGGFNESYQIYEDCEFIHRIYDRYGFVVIKNYVTTSARKYRANGTYRLQFHFTVIHLKKWLGATPKELSDYYHKYIIS
jgi:rSAM/selenodomain-associated transferase 2